MRAASTALLSAAVLAVLAGVARADLPEVPGFVEHVQPILRQHCVVCHNQNRASNDLALDSFEAVMKGGAGGRAIEPGRLDESYLWLLVNHDEEPVMPPAQDKLPEAKLAVLRLWIEKGAPKEPPKPKITYVEHAQPILREHCFSCHNRNRAQNDLALDSYETLMRGGAAGAAVEPGNPGGSYLWRLVSREEEPFMPLNQPKLPEVKLAVLESWIAGGALKDADSEFTPKKGPTVDLSVTVSGKPDGPAAMPEGLGAEPVVAAPRAGAVTALASSPWAPVVAVAGQRQIVLYHAGSLELLGILPFPEGVPQVLRFSRSGALLLAGGGHAAKLGKVAVYDVRTGKRVFAAGDELDTVLGADIDAGQRHIALGGPERLVRVFAVEDGSMKFEIRKHTDWVLAAQFSPDGILLASADRAGGVHVWEAHSANEFLNLAEHKAAVTAMSWRADSNLLATASEDGTIKLWDIVEGKLLRSINAHSGGVTAIDVARDGRFVSAGRDRQLKLWDAGGQPVRTLGTMDDLPLEIVFTHDAARVVAGDFQGEVRVVQTDDGTPLGTITGNPK